MQFAERFWAKVDRTPTCWEWKAAQFLGGYGAIQIAGKLKKAHRVSWELEHGPIPNGLCVLHHCDNPSCVRPSHLFLGTHADNAADRNQKGRTAKDTAHSKDLRGERLSISKLTDAKVRLIRKSYPRQTYKQIADRLGVSLHTIYHVVKGHTWSHVKEVRA